MDENKYVDSDEGVELEPIYSKYIQVDESGKIVGYSTTKYDPYTIGVEHEFDFAEKDYFYSDGKITEKDSGVD